MKTQQRAVRDGFTLLEILAAMAILMVVVGYMSVVFTESEKSWTLGTGRIDNNVSGRGGLDMLTHDLQYAVADEKLTFRLQPDREGSRTFGFDNDEICCVSMQHDHAMSHGGNRKPRNAREIHFWVQPMRRQNDSGAMEDIPHRYALVKGYQSDPEAQNGSYDGSTPDWNPDWYKDNGGRGRSSRVAEIAENVTAVAFFCPDMDGKIVRDYDSVVNSNRTPEYVDVYFEALNQRDAIQAAELASRTSETDNEVLEIVRAKARRYTTRVYFHNRYGYQQRLTTP